MNMTNKLSKLRQNIDNIDKSIVLLLAEREVIASKIAICKIQEGKDIIDPAREKNMIENLKKTAHISGLEPSFIEQLYATIIHQSVKMQNKHIAALTKKTKNDKLI